LGGHLIARKLWKDFYTEDISGIVFMIDSSDQKRFEEAKKVLDEILTEESLADVPILVLGNKVDKKKAISREELIEIFELNVTGTEIKKYKQLKKENDNFVRPLEVFMCSIIKEVGFGDGLGWISNFI
jgi:GTP-binding protein SAR1